MDSDSRRLLVVAADGPTAETLSDVAELWGLTARVARDEAAALREAREYRPELVLLDLDGGGVHVTVARALRQELGAQEPLLVALTSGVGEASRAREAGCHHCLTKPVDPEVLGKLLVPGTAPGEPARDSPDRRRPCSR